MSKLQSIYRHHKSELLALLLFFVGGILGLLGLIQRIPLLLGVLGIVILSALNSQEDVVKGFNTGADDFIMKPIIMEKLLTCVVTQMQLIEATRK